MPILITPDPPGLPPVVTREQALAAGLTSGQVAHRLRAGVWRSFHRGIYVRFPVTDPATGQDNPFARAASEHVLRAVSACLSRPGSVVGLASAAVAWGLPLVTPVPGEVHLLVGRSSWSGSRGDVRVHRAVLAPDEVQLLPDFAVPATTPLRTWADIAATADLPDALSVGDRLLRLGWANPHDLVGAASRADSMASLKALDAAQHCDGRRETPLESLSWARFLQWGIPLPLMQHEFHDAAGLIGRVDFYWPQARLVGEADGRIKYADPDVLWKEKQRQLRLERKGLRVMRWVNADLMDPRRALRDHLMRLLGVAA